ncbi:aminopeptidase N [Streptomyces catenulae]|uniref:Aminopeptidase N n=1 Tax=Streptomyces catenulae TaxID=66875 RepID=A0ABV2Z3G1_9ACTN|nr:aminopeptidase N [Streptomyces catenulae]
MPALQRDEAQTRAGLLDVRHHTIHLDLTQGEKHFGSHADIRFTVRDGVADGAPVTTFFEVKPAALLAVTLDGTPLDPALLDDNRFPLTDLAPGDHELQVEARMAYSRTGEGMHRFTDPADGEAYVYTQLFMEDVQRVFATFDQPDLKSVFALTVTAPEEWSVLANGVTTHEGGGVWRAASTPPISTYLVAVAAGPWHSVRTEHAGLPFGIHCRRSLAPYLDADAEEILDLTRRCYDRYRDLFDEPYPFDSYDQAFVPEFNAGAMENPGLVTFRDEFVYRSAVTDTERQTRGMVIAHEMAHMWFGDLVTLRWWDDIWLNESFAEYMGYQVLSEATRFTDTWVDFGTVRKSWGYEADQRPSSHPVAPTPEDVPDTASALLNFDGISYAKGASALRQLVAWIGEKDFLAGINDHLTRHRFGNATLADFLDSLARHTDRDVPGWAARWLRTSGPDTLTATVEPQGDTWQLAVGHHGSRPHRIAVGLYDEDATDPARLTLRRRFETDIPQEAGTTRHPLPGPVPALVVLNDGDLSYTKVRLDPDSWETVARSLSGIPAADGGALTRAVLWNAARDMVRDGDLPPAAYLDLVRRHLPAEADPAVVAGVLRFARTPVADHFLPAAERHTALGTLTALSRDILRHTEGATDPTAASLRLTAVRAFIDSATSPEGIQDWLDDGSVPGGPALDPELRWRILARLAALGALTPARIDDELSRDPSATGAQGAARCRAALPDPAAKEAAWRSLFTTDPEAAPSNYLFTAAATGFWAPEQHDLLRPYVARFFTDVVPLATHRGPALAEAAARYAFPAAFVDEETLRLGHACLATDAPTPALRRGLTDQLDDLARALRIRSGKGTAATGGKAGDA